MYFLQIRLGQIKSLFDQGWFQILEQSLQRQQVAPGDVSISTTHTHFRVRWDEKEITTISDSFPGETVGGPRRGGLTWASGWPWIPPWTRCPGGRNPPSRTRGFRARPWRDRGAHLTAGTERLLVVTSAPLFQRTAVFAVKSNFKSRHV